MVQNSSAVILVKAYPQPSKKHSETVCCAGVGLDGKWRRLFPIRFRQLSAEKSFSRWDIVDFSYSKPSDDSRVESCRVHEESISISGRVKLDSEKQKIVASATVASERAAMALKQSLALIRPMNMRFKYRRRSDAEIEEMRQSFAEQARQASMFDKDLDALEPCPFEFSMVYDDEDGPHQKTCADWETYAAFFNLRKSYSEQEVLKHLEKTYVQDYARKGVVFALGNMKKRPQTWQLLGIFSAFPTVQMSLDL